MQGQYFQQPPRPDFAHDFTRAPQADIERSTFDLSHRYETTFDAGILVPFYLEDVMPADTLEVSVTPLVRLNTPKRPLFDDATFSTFFFNVPYRIEQTHFVNMMGEQTDPGDSIDFAEPIVTTETPVDPATWAEHTLWDYFGFPISSQLPPGNWLTASRYPFEAYYKIWNRWFRDQNLQDSLPEDPSDAPHLSSDYVLQRRGKRHDYFTSCLPWPQKGDEVFVPLSGTAPVTVTGGALITEANSEVGTANPYRINVAASPDSGLYLKNYLDGDGGADLIIPTLTGTADMSGVTAASINSWRLAFQTQRLLERSARGGTRYPELVNAQFSVIVPDYRVQYPEYLGGGRTPLFMNPVPQTAPTAGTDAQGQLAGVGAFVGGHHGFTHSFVEHGLVMGIMCVDATLSYTQGLQRQWRGGRTRYDFPTPAFMHLGEQAVLSREIYAQGDNVGGDENVFGYQEAWAEYRTHPSRFTGLMRPQATNSLAVWNLAQDFTARPTLSAAFIQSDPPFDRVVAVPSEPHFTCDLAIRVMATRPMPTYSVPGMIDHF